MRIVCQQTILMKYHAIFVRLFVFEKAVKFEIVVCCIIGGALYMYYHLEEAESVQVFVFSSSTFLSTSLFAMN